MDRQIDDGEFEFHDDPVNDPSSRSSRWGRGQKPDIESLRTEMFGEFYKLGRFVTARADQTDRFIQSLREDVRALHQSVELLLDTVRENAVLSAARTGAATSGTHNDHVPISQAYQSLIRQKLPEIAKLLCPDKGPREQLPEKRAMAASALIRLLFSHATDGRLTLASVRQELAAMGYATDASAFDDQLGRLMERADDVRERMFSLTPAAYLRFDQNLDLLEPGAYDAWKSAPLPDGRPAFLVAPAYVVTGTQETQLTPPVVFLKAGSGQDGTAGS